MRVVGYIVLLLLALYFIFVKPYLLAKRIYWELEVISLSFEKGVGIRKFLLYLPLKHKNLYLFLKDTSLKPWEIKAREFNLIEVSQAPPSDKPFDYDFTPIVRLAKRVNLSVDKIYISTNYVPYGESLTLFIPQTQIRAGKVYFKDWTQAYWMHYKDVHFLEIFLEKAHIEGDKFIVDRARVKSPLYSFELSAYWQGKRGGFEGWGNIEPIGGESYQIGKIKINSLKGTLTYTRLRASFSGMGESLEIKSRRGYTNLRLEGEYLWEWRKENRLTAKVWSDKTFLDIVYSLKDHSLNGTFKGFLVDKKLLGIDRDVLAYLNGSVSLNLEEKFLELRADAPLLKVEEGQLEKTSLILKLYYKDRPKGSFEFTALQPFYLSYEGSFLGKNLTGRATLIDYPLKRGEFSSKLSYMGSVDIREGVLYMEGKGKASHIVYKDVSLDGVDYNLSLSGDTYNIKLWGPAFALLGEGSLRERSLKGRLSLRGMDFSYRDISLKSLKGDIDLRVVGNSFGGIGRIEGFVSREDLSSWFDVGFDIWDLKGSFKGGLKCTKLSQWTYEEGSFKGSLADGVLNLSFNFPEGLEGRGHYSFRDGSYDFEGALKHPFAGAEVKVDYEIKGVNKNFDVVLRGEARYREFLFPLKGKIYLRGGERLQALFEGFTTGKNLISIKVGSIKVYGDLKEGFIEVQPATLWLGREVLSRVEFERGSYKNKGFQLDGKVLGVLEGSLKVAYDQGFQAYSEGFLDLGRLFSLIRSRAFGDGEGKVLYRFSYEGDGINLMAHGEKLVLRSRYLALPLEGSIELSMKENKLKGGVKFYGNQRASIVGSLEGDSKGAKVNFEVSQLPVLLREENLRASLAFSGKGYIQSHYKNLSIGGDFYTSGLINLQKLTTKKAAPSEDYKRVSLDLKITSSEPLRINLPEGYIYTDLLVNAKGSLYEPEYKINAYLKGGNLNYFGKNFYVRRGEVFFTKKEQNLDLTLITPTPDYSIIIDIKGNPQYPKAVVRSEPPRDTREVLTTFVLGGKETEGLIPVASAIVSQVPQLTDFLKGANQLTGLDVKIQASPTLSPTGEVGINTTISKEITERIHLEHRQSTLKNPKETYTSGEVKLTPNTSIDGRLYSDKSQEYKVRLRKKFNF